MCVYYKTNMFFSLNKSFKVIQIGIAYDVQMSYYDSYIYCNRKYGEKGNHRGKRN